MKSPNGSAESISTFELERVTIVAEGVLEPRLLSLLRECGARGWTLTEVRGEGSRGVRASDWEGNVKIEALVSSPCATRILTSLARDYFEHFAVVAFTDRVRVVRGDKYV